MKGPIVHPTKAITVRIFRSRLGNAGADDRLALIFFPFIWFSLYFLLEPINIWLGHRTLVEWTKIGNWQPVISALAGRAPDRLLLGDVELFLVPKMGLPRALGKLDPYL